MHIVSITIMGVSVFILTWNANGNTPRGDLAELLRRSPPPDVYAVGIQELEQEKASSSSYYSSFYYRKEKKEEVTKEQEWE